MITKEYVLDQARQKGMKAWFARNSRYSVEASYNPKGGAGVSEDAISALESFFRNASGVYEIEMRDRSGFEESLSARNKKDVDVWFAEVHITPDRKVSGTNIGEGMPNVDLIRGYETQMRDLALQTQKIQYEMQLKRMEDQINYLKEQHEKQLAEAKDSSKNIMGYLGQISSIFNSNPVGNERPVNGFNAAPEAPAKTPSLENTINAVNRLLELDPDFPENISKLARLAEKNPAMYRQAVSILNSFV